MWNNILWTDIEKDDSINLFEHPVYNCLIDKKEYFCEFENVLTLLNGETMTDFIDIFFKRDSVITNSLIFAGDDEKMDFYEWAVEEGCFPTLNEIHTGEDNDAKFKRKLIEEQECELRRLMKLKQENDSRSKQIQAQKQINKQRTLNLDNNIVSYKEYKILQSMMTNINKMLDNNKKKEKVIKAINKFDNTLFQLKEIVNNYYVLETHKNIKNNNFDSQLNIFEHFMNNIKQKIGNT